MGAEQTLLREQHSRLAWRPSGPGAGVFPLLSAQGMDVRGARPEITVQDAEQGSRERSPAAHCA
jgi:hypothetical protein